MFTFNGQTYTVPGVYGTVEIINVGGSTLPVFNVLLALGPAKKGIPYSATGKKGYEVIKPFSDEQSAKNYYGVSKLTTAMSYHKAAGAGVVFFLNSAALTLASAVIKDNQGSPANTFGVSPADQFYGAAGNDIELTIATSNGTTTITITPPKLTKFLSANASTSSPYLQLDDVEGLVVGQTVLVTSNAAAGAADSLTIAAIDTVNNQITLSGNPGTAWATADYARIYQEDTNNAQVGTFTATNTVNDVINWINSGSILVATRSTYTGIIPTTLAKTQLQLISGATKGTSPDATETVGGDYDTIASDIPQMFEEFENYNGFRIRLVNLLTPTASVHAVFKTLTLTLRNSQKSIKLVTGCALGDYNKTTSDSDYPVQRAKTLNSQDVVLAGMGLDGIDAYQSLAPFYAGLVSANSVKHNSTNDNVSATTVEFTLGEFNKATLTTSLVGAGVLVAGTGKNGFYIVMGVNTYQYQTTQWNATDKATYLNMQRDIVDYVYEGYKDQMELGVGADGYDATVARAQGLSILKTYYEGGFITDYQMISSVQQGNAVITNPKILPLEGTDYAGFTLSVLINN